MTAVTEEMPATRSSLYLGTAVSVAVVAVMATISTFAFGTVFSSWSFVVPAIVGALAGSAITLAAQRFNLLFGEVLALSLIMPVVVGPLVSTGLGFFSGVVFGWVDLLSATPPVDLTAALRALPFITAYLASVVGGEFLRPSRQSGLAILGPILGLVLTALFTVGSDAVHLIVGLSMVAGLLLLTWTQRFEDQRGSGLAQDDPGLQLQMDPDGGSHDLQVDRSPLRRSQAIAILLGCCVLVPVVALAPLLGPRLPFADAAEDRLDLRELQTPPWNPLALPSPLVELKASLLSAERLGEEQPLFTAMLDDTEAAPVTTRFRSATLVGYDGVYWSVAEPELEADFVPVDAVLPTGADEAATDVTERTAVDAEPTRMTVTPLTDMGHWVPLPGATSRLDFATQTDVRMSLSTGTVGLPNQLRTGSSYEVTFVDWPTVDDEVLAETIFPSDGRPSEPALLPPKILTTAADFTTGFGQRSGARVISIRDQLRQGSYDADMAPGHSYGPLAEMLTAVDVDGSDPNNPVYQMRGVQGNEEQYASVAALLVRLSDIPVRVATGWIIPEDRWVNGEATVLASDVNAWIEVRVNSAGWVPIDVTPDRSQEPIEVQTGTEEVGVPVADPPKEPPPPDDAERPEISDVEATPEPEPTPEPDDERRVRAVPVRTVVGVSLLVPLLLCGLAVVAIVGAKRVRRERRRRAETPEAQIAGAWAELLDRVEESGSSVPRRLTPMETAIALEETHSFAQGDDGRLRRLADRVTASAFHPNPPDSEVAAAAWDDYDALVAEIHDQIGTKKRLQMSVDPRPLLGEQLPAEVHA